MNTIQKPKTFRFLRICLVYALLAGSAPFSVSAFPAQDLESVPLLAAATSGQLNMIKDINPGGDSNPRKFISYNGKLVFVADDGTHGEELWISDGTADGTQMLKDIRLGSEDSGIESLIVYSGKIFFKAFDGSGFDLWFTDGTLGGTQILKDVDGPSSPHNFVEFDGNLYFAAKDSTHGYELWVSDGTPGGTQMLKDIKSGDSSSHSMPGSFAVINNTLFFAADDGLKGREMWTSNGTEIGTIRFKDIFPGNDGSGLSALTALNNNLYFRATDGVTTGYELWFSNGTKDGTILLKDIYPDAGNSSPDWFTPLNNKMYFAANSDGSGNELWASDGTPEGTGSVKEFSPVDHPKFLEVLNGKLYYQGYLSTTGYELMVSDGTDIGTDILMDVNPGTESSSPTYLTAYEGKLYFIADDGTNGIEMWVSDGTEGGTQMVFDLLPGSGSGLDTLYANYFFGMNGNLYFQATNGTDGTELWAYDPSYIFADGFESGDIFAWSSFKGALWDGDFSDLAGCKLCVDAAYALEGAYGLKVRVPNKKPHFVQDDSPDLETRYRARFYVKMGKFKLSNLGKINLFMGKNGKKTPILLQVRKKGKKFQIRPRIRTDAGKMLKTKWTVLPRKPTVVEIDWMAAESTTNHNGYIQLYINGTLKRTKNGVNNDKMRINLVRLGVAKKIGAAVTASGAFFLDGFVSDSLDYIGP